MLLPCPYAEIDLPLSMTHASICCCCCSSCCTPMKHMTSRALDAELNDSSCIPVAEQDTTCEAVTDVHATKTLCVAHPEAECPAQLGLILGVVPPRTILGVIDLISRLVALALRRLLLISQISAVLTAASHTDSRGLREEIAVRRLLWLRRLTCGLHAPRGRHRPVVVTRVAQSRGASIILLLRHGGWLVQLPLSAPPARERRGSRLLYSRWAPADGIRHSTTQIRDSPSVSQWGLDHGRVTWGTFASRAAVQV